MGENLEFLVNETLSKSIDLYIDSGQITNYGASIQSGGDYLLHFSKQNKSFYIESTNQWDYTIACIDDTDQYKIIQNKQHANVYYEFKYFEFAKIKRCYIYMQNITNEEKSLLLRIGPLDLQTHSKIINFFKSYWMYLTFAILGLIILILLLLEFIKFCKKKRKGLKIHVQKLSGNKKQNITSVLNSIYLN